MNDNLGQLVGNTIRNYRKRRGLSQEELAHLSSMSVSFLGEVERNEKIPTILSLNRICKALGIGMSELFEQIQPINKTKDAEIISSIVNKIQSLSLKDIQTINQMIDLMLKFKK